MTFRGKGVEDRRIHRTRKLLREALLSLIAEKPYDSIVVKEILDRADVGRSTFYSHFEDKDDLLVSGIQDMLGPVPPPTKTPGRTRDRILWFSLAVFEHHYRHAHGWGDRIGPKGRAVLHEHLRRALMAIIVEVMRRDPPRLKRQPSRVPPDVLSPYIASTFVLVLDWWLDRGMRMPPSEINEVFRRLAVPTLDAVCE